MNIVYGGEFKGRFSELVCVLFGHSWNEYSSHTSSTGLILEESNKCSCCGLENHDRSGYLANHKDEIEE